MEAGDVVQIKSGGPNMTIGDKSTNGITGIVWCTCFWFEEEGFTKIFTKRVENFPESCLILTK